MQLCRHLQQSFTGCVLREVSVMRLHRTNQTVSPVSAVLLPKHVFDAKTHMQAVEGSHVTGRLIPDFLVFYRVCYILSVSVMGNCILSQKKLQKKQNKTCNQPQTSISFLQTKMYSSVRCFPRNNLINLKNRTLTCLFKKRRVYISYEKV